MNNLHLAAFGYQPLRMKTIHLATGFFLAITGKYFRHQLLNETSVLTSVKGLSDNYKSGEIRKTLTESDKLSSEIDERRLNQIRVQLNAVFDNDDALFAAYETNAAGRRKEGFGCDYTVASARFLTNHKRNDGFAGAFAFEVFSQSENGKAILDFARATLLLVNHSPLEKVAAPLLDATSEAEDWDNSYSTSVGEMDDGRLSHIADLMKVETAAIKKLCENIRDASQHTKLRFLVIGVSAWLLSYLLKESAPAGISRPVLFMDFTSNAILRVRQASQASYTRLRELVAHSYIKFADEGRIDSEAETFTKLKKDEFKILEDHFSTLAVRSGFAQPRASNVAQKHLELQPDTARVLLLTLLDGNQIQPLEDTAQQLLEVWGICFGGRVNHDANLLRREGYHGLDADDHVKVNRACFVEFLKRLELASEPSDGLVLVASKPEALV